MKIWIKYAWNCFMCIVRKWHGIHGSSLACHSVKFDEELGQERRVLSQKRILWQISEQFDRPTIIIQVWPTEQQEGLYSKIGPQINQTLSYFQAMGSLYTEVRALQHLLVDSAFCASKIVDYALTRQPLKVEQFWGSVLCNERSMKC